MLGVEISKNSSFTSLKDYVCFHIELLLDSLYSSISEEEEILKLSKSSHPPLGVEEVPCFESFGLRNFDRDFVLCNRRAIGTSPFTGFATHTLAQT